jgi:hypothetical protein
MRTYLAAVAPPQPPPTTTTRRPVLGAKSPFIDGAQPANGPSASPVAEVVKNCRRESSLMAPSSVDRPDVLIRAR